MDYITIGKLQSKLDGDANQTTVRKLIDKMAQDGYVEATSNRRLGKRVIHSDAAEKKLHQVRKALDFEAMDVDVNASLKKLNHAEVEINGNKKADASTCGVLHSIGSDITRMQARSEFDMHQNGSLSLGVVSLFQRLGMVHELPQARLGQQTQERVPYLQVVKPNYMRIPKITRLMM